MNRVRLLVLIVGPLPIVGLSMALTSWLRPEGPRGLAANEVLRRGSFTSAAAAAEIEEPAGGAALAEPCQKQLERWSERMGAACKVIARPPFVIAGDLSTAELDDWHQRTIAPAARAMANTYFRSPPTEPITILLFSGEASYNHYTERLFGERDISIYGYYKPLDRTLVMNIGTGGGTLVHELTHALVDFDFPKIPAWFNEGLASLHEQCRFREDAGGPWIEGVENWRLPGLQKAVRSEKLRSLAALIQEKDFRGRQEGTNYAQARYFCLYMQRQGVLANFYRTFRKNRAQDPRGAQSVLAMFPGKTWEQLDRDFQTWVLTLKRE